jgi:class 3 adenylate cyclase
VRESARTWRVDALVEIGPVELRGLSEALRLFTARHDTRAE